ncbi:hypothetical protein Acr_00g0041480 [Actinidia rufa]|uniref:Uncharacterized protein n=1 Tax=Actinidia rufa TaxID=165716 RepID=A0A7J0DIG8_9ERIC|nr:hypothetical protein Acr_00g0041480 [Actinidia rufa]
MADGRGSWSMVRFWDLVGIGDEGEVELVAGGGKDGEEDQVMKEWCRKGRTAGFGLWWQWRNEKVEGSGPPWRNVMVRGGREVEKMVTE